MKAKSTAKVPAKAKAPAKTAAKPGANGDLADGLLSTAGQGQTAQIPEYVAKAAAQLTEAASKKGDIALALDQNLRLWMAIKTLAQKANGSFDGELSQRLIRLSEYVAQETIRVGSGALPDSTLATLVNINVQIAQGMLDATAQEAIRLRAHQIWEEQGRPDGQDVAHWIQARRELLGS